MIPRRLTSPFSQQPGARRHPALIVAGFAAFAIAWVLFAPTQLGGSTSYVLIAGSSMNPGLHRGDLVLLRGRSDYSVGDAVGYRSRELGKIVLHRIVGQANGRYVFKGDNNSYKDGDRPLRRQLVGKLWIRLPYVGVVAEQLRAPRNAALFAGVLAFFFATGRGRGPDRRTRSQLPRVPGGAGVGGRRASDAPPRDPWKRPTLNLPPHDRETLLLVLAGIGVVAALIALMAFTRPTSETVAADAPYRHSGSFGYSAKVRAGDVYPTGRVEPGQPLFLQLVDRVAVRFAYRLRSDAPHAVAGTGKLVAVLSDGAGWRRTIKLQAKTAFVGDTLTLRGTIVPDSLRAQITRFEAQTGVRNDSYKLTVLPQVYVQGTVAGKELRESFAPPLMFRLDLLRLALEDTKLQGGGTNTLKRTRTGVGTAETPVQISFVFVKADVSTARMLAIVTLLAALLALALVGIVLPAPRLLDEPARIAAAYRDWLIPVAARRRARAATAIQVASMDSLARLAERYDRMILHEHEDGVHTYLVEEAGSHYFYETKAGVVAVEATVEPETKPLGKDAGVSETSEEQNELERRRAATNAKRRAARKSASQ